MKLGLSISAAAALLATSACAGPAASLPSLAAQQSTAYRLGAGDELRVIVFGLDSVNNTYRVSDTGTIAVPLLDPVAVADKTIDEAQTAIAAAFRAKQVLLDPKVSVQVQNYRPFFILGEVLKPGEYPYRPGISVTEAVTIAGGYTFRANTKRAMIKRNAQQANADAMTTVQPGDTITIFERWF